MTSSVRVRTAAGCIAGGAVVALLSGCAPQTSADSLGRVRAWIPKAAVAALPLLGAGDLPRAAGPRTVGGLREAVTPIDGPWTSTGHWWSMWSMSRGGARVGQQVLVKAADGHFYSADYVWRDDVILEGCVESPVQCASFVDARALDVDEARSMLAHARQFSPALYQQFFGVSPAVEAKS